MAVRHFLRVYGLGSRRLLCAQGREKDVVLFSAVRTAAGGRIGFVADERRLNVGLTRARASLLVLGCARALRADVHWDALVRHCSAVGCDSVFGAVSTS